jgi:hypothetical protein
VDEGWEWGGGCRREAREGGDREAVGVQGREDGGAEVAGCLWGGGLGLNMRVRSGGGGEVLTPAMTTFLIGGIVREVVVCLGLPE